MPYAGTTVSIQTPPLNSLPCLPLSFRLLHLCVCNSYIRSVFLFLIICKTHTDNTILSRENNSSCWPIEFEILLEGTQENGRIDDIFTRTLNQLPFADSVCGPFTLFVLYLHLYSMVGKRNKDNSKIKVILEKKYNCAIAD